MANSADPNQTPLLNAASGQDPHCLLTGRYGLNETVFSPRSGPFSLPHAETIDPPVFSVLWFNKGEQVSWKWFYRERIQSSWEDKWMHFQVRLLLRYVNIFSKGERELHLMERRRKLPGRKFFKGILNTSCCFFFFSKVPFQNQSQNSNSGSLDSESDILPLTQANVIIKKERKKVRKKERKKATNFIICLLYISLSKKNKFSSVRRVYSISKTKKCLKNKAA